MCSGSGSFELEMAESHSIWGPTCRIQILNSVPLTGVLGLKFFQVWVPFSVVLKLPSSFSSFLFLKNFLRSVSLRTRSKLDLLSALCRHFKRKRMVMEQMVNWYKNDLMNDFNYRTKQIYKQNTRLGRYWTSKGSPRNFSRGSWLLGGIFNWDRCFQRNKRWKQPFYLKNYWGYEITYRF